MYLLVDDHLASRQLTKNSEKLYSELVLSFSLVTYLVGE